MFSLLLMSGFALAPANHGAVIAPAALTGAGVLLSAAVLRERLPAARLLGVPVIFAGLGLIGWAGLRAGGGGLVLLGDLLFALAGVSWAVFTVLLRRWSIDPVRGTAVVAVLAMLAYTPLWLATADLSTLAAAGAAEVALQVVMQGALAGVVAVLAFSRAVALLGASRAALFPSLVPAGGRPARHPRPGRAAEPAPADRLAVVTLGLAAALGLVRLPLPVRRRVP
jgi:drug/metabolite transporter (DMT)-like permease